MSRLAETLLQELAEAAGTAVTALRIRAVHTLIDVTIAAEADLHSARAGGGEGGRTPTEIAEDLQSQANNAGSRLRAGTGNQLCGLSGVVFVFGRVYLPQGAGNWQGATRS
jgi:hypothetical protein